MIFIKGINQQFTFFDSNGQPVTEQKEKEIVSKIQANEYYIKVTETVVTSVSKPNQVLFTYKMGGANV